MNRGGVVIATFTFQSTYGAGGSMGRLRELSPLENYQGNYVNSDWNRANLPADDIALSM